MDTLNPADQFEKRRLRCRRCLRYVDDMLPIADDKQTLWAWRDDLQGVLAGLRLKAHEASAIPQSISAGNPFLSFLIFSARRRLKRRNAVNARRLAAAGDVTENRVTSAVRGWVNHARCGDTWRLRRVVLGGGKGHSILPPATEDRVGR